jgi:DMSO/TMAO reductase YedYZ molybdopterin-dependent catalytic subunit
MVIEARDDVPAEVPEGVSASPDISGEELQLAARNHGMPLEALRYDVTPVGLHYLLIHFDIPEVDVATWRLEIGGHVGRSLSLTLDDVRSRAAIRTPVTMECAGNGRARLTPRPISQPWLNEAVGTAEWTGTPLWPLLEEARILEGTVEIVFTGQDRGVQGGIEHDYERSLPLEEVRRSEILLAYEINGMPLPPQHGYPLRLLVPGWYGMTSVKWLNRISAATEPFRGYQQETAYRYLRSEDDDELAMPVTRIYPRSLMVPPGIPEFMSRTRVVGAGSVVLQGRAWSGWAPIARVEVSTDGGETWAEAIMEEPPARYAWRKWTHPWEAMPGQHELVSRATDEAGNMQPLEQPWNLQGMSNNMAQRVSVTVVTEPA